MAEPLKHQFSTDVIHRLALDLVQQWPRFDREAFTREALHGFLDLELMPRAAHLAAVLQRHLPPRFADAAVIMGASLGPPLSSSGGNGMTPFFYLPHVLWVAAMDWTTLTRPCRCNMRLPSASPPNSVWADSLSAMPHDHCNGCSNG